MTCRPTRIDIFGMGYSYKKARGMAGGLLSKRNRSHTHDKNSHRQDKDTHKQTHEHITTNGATTA